jgi:predicted dehydrogenase
VTNWGAHHLDIAQWGLGAETTGPVEIEGRGVFDDRPNCYNTAQTFGCTMKFANGNTIILTSGKDGILFEGEKEHIYVNRGRITGNLVTNMTAEMQSQVDAELARLYRGPLGELDEEIFGGNEFTKEQFLAVDASHMENFINCIREGTQPISDVPSSHRTISSCHLANIAMRLRRKLRWDPLTEDFINDPEASSMVARPQRTAYAV